MLNGGLLRSGKGHCVGFFVNLFIAAAKGVEHVMKASDVTDCIC